MPSVPTPTSPFDVLPGSEPDLLLAAATAAATHSTGNPVHGALVIVTRPDGGDHQVVAGGGVCVLRAAVSVAAAAGNDRAWRDAPHGDTHELPVRSLPEVIAAAADAAGVRSAHIGCVRVGDAVESVAIWFETWEGVAARTTRRDVLAALAAAGDRERDRRAESALVAIDEPEGAPGDDRRTFDPTDPQIDPLTGLLRADPFAERLEQYDCDEATLLLLDLDAFATVAAEWGDETSDRIIREVADRLVANCRRDDVIARLDHDRFAVLFGRVDRAEVIQIAKRLLSAVAEPLTDDGRHRITATIALAHQSGLIDLDEMLDSASDAIASGKRAGAGRLVLAA